MQSSIYTKSTTTTSVWVTPQQVQDAIATLPSFIERASKLANSYDISLKYALGWLANNANPITLAETLNKLVSEDEYLPVIVGKLAARLEIGVLPVNSFVYENIKAAASFQLIQLLMDTGVIHYTTKTVRNIDEGTGQISWKTQTILTFGNPTNNNNNYIHGVHPTAGVVLQKRYKVRAGGRALKLNSKEKSFLKSASSIELRIIDIDPEEVRAYLKESKWYKESLAKGLVDRIVLDDVINTQVEKFKLLQAEEGFFLSMWLDYRTRVYYELTELGFNPHGKLFETSLFELRHGILIDEDGADALKYSAVVIVDGRTTHHEAEAKFDANPKYYLDALRQDTGDRGENLYNSRLAQAIEDYYNGVPSHFLLSEDATNGGMQHGGIGFRSSKMMIASNVGGASTQQDSHQQGADAFNLYRDTYKELVSQGLFHGESLKSIASKLDITLPVLKEYLSTAFGREVFNIQTIAQWGSAIVDQNNPSLMWTTADGFRAQSIAYTEGVPLQLYAFTESKTNGYSTCKVHREMPMIKDRKGNPIYGVVDGNKSQGGDNKLRGLYANATHSIDATALRSVHHELVAQIGTGGFYKHDNFLVHANHMKYVRKGYKAALIAEYECPSYTRICAEIVENYNADCKPEVPALPLGDATLDMVVNSHYFLSA